MKPIEDVFQPDLKCKLVIIAREIIRKKGMSALTLVEVAKQASTSTQAIYTLFGGKLGLIQAIYQYWVMELEQRLIVLIPTLRPDELILNCAQMYREQALSDPELFMAGTTPMTVEAGVLEMMYQSSTFAQFAQFLQTGMDSGIFKPQPNTKAIAKMLWAAVHGLILFELCNPPVEGESISTIADLVNVFANGLSVV